MAAEPRACLDPPTSGFLGDCCSPCENVLELVCVPQQSHVVSVRPEHHRRVFVLSSGFRWRESEGQADCGRLDLLAVAEQSKGWSLLEQTLRLCTLLPVQPLHTMVFIQQGRRIAE